MIEKVGNKPTPAAERLVGNNRRVVCGTVFENSEVLERHNDEVHGSSSNEESL